MFSDSEKHGLVIVVTGRHERAPTVALAREVAERCWADRGRFKKTLTSLDQAVALAVQPDRQPMIFSDSGDKPGGGGTGRTTDLLQALIRSGAEDVLYDARFDPPLAADAHAVGPGASFRARINVMPARRAMRHSRPTRMSSAGTVVGRLGTFAGRTLRLGPSAALRMGGVTVVVISARQQTADPMFFQMFGLDVGRAHTVAMKSRGHFWTEFRPWFLLDGVSEIDTEELTSPVLERRQ